MDLKDLIDAGIGLLLLTSLVGGHRRWWVYGWLYAEVVKDRDYWRRAALRSTALAESATEVAARKTEDAP